MSVDDFIDGLPDSYDSWNDTYRVDFFRDNLNGFNSLPNETQVLKIIWLLPASVFLTICYCIYFVLYVFSSESRLGFRQVIYKERTRFSTLTFLDPIMHRMTLGPFSTSSQSQPIKIYVTLTLTS